MIVIALPVLVLIIGALMYALSANPKLVAMGFEMFKWGLLAALLLFGLHPVVFH